MSKYFATHKEHAEAQWSKTVTNPIAEAVKFCQPSTSDEAICDDPALTTHTDLITRAYFSYGWGVAQFLRNINYLVYLLRVQLHLLRLHPGITDCQHFTYTKLKF